jgi:hypothetical protein
MTNKHENILEELLPVPEGYRLVRVINNTMQLIKISDYEKNTYVYTIDELSEEAKKKVVYYI